MDFAMKMQGTKHRSMSTEWFGKRQDLLLYTANFGFGKCVISYTFFLLHLEVKSRRISKCADSLEAQTQEIMPIHAILYTYFCFHLLEHTSQKYMCVVVYKSISAAQWLFLAHSGVHQNHQGQWKRPPSGQFFWLVTKITDIFLSLICCLDFT